MTKILRFQKFAAQGGDWGAGVASLIGQKYPSSVCGIHLNLLFAPRDKITLGNSESETRYSERLAHWLKEETGYQQIQGTKPQTLAFGLTDSPAGLAAWIAEKFRSWSDNDGVPESAIILRCLVDAVKKIKRELIQKRVNFHAVVFIRNDVFELLVAGTADYGKDMSVNLDWTDKRQLVELLRRRFEFGNKEFHGKPITEIWARIPLGSPSSTSALNSTANCPLARTFTGLRSQE